MVEASRLSSINAKPPFREPGRGFPISEESNKSVAASSAFCQGDSSYSFGIS
jgi:hypothetical protein